jgi:hypothetical protein
MRLSSAAILPVLALSFLAGCGGDDEPADAATTTSAPATTEDSTPSSAPPTTSGTPDASGSPGPSGSPGAASPGQVPRPAAGTCEPVAESADGRYVVADAGEITLRLENGSLSLNVSSSNGWGTSVSSGGDEADVDFRRGEEELEFEADLEDGRLVIKICAD